jgi:hypothetical protein
VRARARVYMCVCVCARARVRMCVRSGGCTIRRWLQKDGRAKHSGPSDRLCCWAVHYVLNDGWLVGLLACLPSFRRLPRPKLRALAKRTAPSRSTLLGSSPKGSAPTSRCQHLRCSWSVLSPATPLPRPCKATAVQFSVFGPYSGQPKAERSCAPWAQWSTF